MSDGKPFVATGFNDTTSTEHNEETGNMSQFASEDANSNVMYNVTKESGENGDANNPTLLSNTISEIQAVQTGAKSADPNANLVTAVDDSSWGQAA